MEKGKTGKRPRGSVSELRKDVGLAEFLVLVVGVEAEADGGKVFLLWCEPAALFWAAREDDGKDTGDADCDGAFDEEKILPALEGIC